MEGMSVSGGPERGKVRLTPFLDVVGKCPSTLPENNPILFIKIPSNS